MANTWKQQAGFTLLEIMLAIFILALIVSMVSVALSGSIKAIDATLDQGNIYYRAQVALERIREDLSSVVLSPDIEFIGGAHENDNGETELLSFASLAHIVFDPEHGRPGMAIIGYSLVPDRNNVQQLLLLRSDVGYLPGEDQRGDGKETEPFLLSDRLRSVRFTFVNKDGAAFERWNTSVDEEEEQQSRLPAAVSCRLEFWLNQEEEISIVFETSVILPVGMIQAGGDQEGKDAS